MDLWILLGSLVVVTLGAEGLVRGASALALRAGISALFVGMTVVGFGTSSPELAASLTATLRGAGDVSVGNVVGSNILNIALIVGITAMIRPIRVQLGAVRRDVLVALGASLVPLASLAMGGTIPRGAGVVLLAVLVGYLGISYRTARRAAAAERDLALEEVESTLDVDPAGRGLGDRVWFNLLLVVAGLALLVLGSRMFVGAALNLARAVGMSDLVVGLTVVAAGTSLPELVTSAVAALRRNPDIAIGNVIGSNIFNLLGILGTCAVVSPQAVGREVILVHTPVMVLVTLALLPVLKTGGVVSRREGIVLVLAYVAYVTTQIVRAG
jgi:cation:H+ antiporter